MVAPIRLRLSRAKGFRLQEHSRAVNGLSAVSVARPGRWGNRYKVAPAFVSAGCRIPEITVEIAVQLFRTRWERALETWPSSRDALDELRGKNLACWCAPDAEHCHADVLLDLANQ